MIGREIASACFNWGPMTPNYERWEEIAHRVREWLILMSSEPKHERGDLLALALEVFLRCLTGAREISHSFMLLIGHQTAVSSPARD